MRSSRSSIDTVVVLTLEDVAGSSRPYTEDQLDAAFAAAIPIFETDVARGFVFLYEQLTGTVCCVARHV
ncbi:MAG: hypothetical protein GEV08_22470 [Acidimicrobiia bacterium]|nr:hypothetical protein [Acidimicrobiia bacterium]